MTYSIFLRIRDGQVKGGESTKKKVQGREIGIDALVWKLKD